MSWSIYMLSQVDGMFRDHQSLWKDDSYGNIACEGILENMRWLRTCADELCNWLKSSS